MSDQRILIERHEPLGIVTINRPKELNAIDVPTIREMERCFKELVDDNTVHVIVVTGPATGRSWPAATSATSTPVRGWRTTLSSPRPCTALSA
jgi:1,4-dihydroxy-2-naphthoyl-CoA synthase